MSVQRMIKRIFGHRHREEAMEAPDDNRAAEDRTKFVKWKVQGTGPRHHCSTHISEWSGETIGPDSSSGK